LIDADVSIKDTYQDGGNYVQRMKGVAFLGGLIVETGDGLPQNASKRGGVDSLKVHGMRHQSRGRLESSERKGRKKEIMK
jgi:hypothetical protein